MRPGSPGQIAEHYLGMDEAMEKKWHDGWFHTGDAFRVDGLGNYQFVDRLTDAIRSRGYLVTCCRGTWSSSPSFPRLGL